MPTKTKKAGKAKVKKAPKPGAEYAVQLIGKLRGESKNYGGWRKAEFDFKIENGYCVLTAGCGDQYRFHIGTIKKLAEIVDKKPKVVTE